MMQFLNFNFTAPRNLINSEICFLETFRKLFFVMKPMPKPQDLFCEKATNPMLDSPLEKNKNTQKNAFLYFINWPFITNLSAEEKS